MITREVSDKERVKFNSVVNHPCQSWEWGEFRKKMGLEVFRIGVFAGQKLTSAYQFTLHQLPYLPYTVGYLPRGPLPNQEMINTLTKIGQEKKTIFFKIEPDIKFKSSRVQEFNVLHVAPLRKNIWSKAM